MCDTNVGHLAASEKVPRASLNLSSSVITGFFFSNELNSKEDTLPNFFVDKMQTPGL